MACVKGYGSTHNRVVNAHEFCFGNTILYELRGDNKLRCCSDCGMYFAMCDIHNRGRLQNRVCHATQVAYFATSCKYNGTSSAIAGFGIAVGQRSTQEWAMPVSARMDRVKRTNNRTDLLAALECIRKMVFVYTHAPRPCDSLPQTWVVASSSDYVVKNYIQNFDNWRSNGWRKSGGGEPANLDLWIKLDDMVEKYENKYHIIIGFYRAHGESMGHVTRLARDAVDSMDTFHF